ncbi:DUF3291 domain-containing protein [Pseudochryseolinea flava]|uniref:DUF3291 domain-containing protein n=1 Tax=Pseudochryseolinea flava TaxID=2059302 RepID=A0A364Y3S4_9BACT|nr:DUF3291 domain-containing protein [Pseudochryseolinea flava]RAW00838.1 DUF3291 domain-containing protein [Pseudochryseolinea flava]
MQTHLAQVNIGKIVASIDSPVMADFVANLDPINALAEQSDGFIWRLKDDGTNNATSITMYGDPAIIVNMSVWKDFDSLFQYVYKSKHVDFFKRRSEWFQKMPEMYVALWYVPVGHTPTVAEAQARIDHLRKHGETDYAFTFKRKHLVKNIQQPG